MATYKNGIESKQKILSTAKALFYVHGFQKTTIAMIAEEAEVPLGLINYYYKKNELLGAIYHDFITILIENIKLQCGSNLENQLQQHIILVKLFYKIIFSDKSNKNIYHLILKNELITEDSHALVRRSLETIVSELDISIKKDIFQRMMIAEYGARRALLEDAFDHLDPETSVDFINFLATITVRLVGIDIDIINYNIKKASELFLLIDVSDIRFLV